MRTYRINKQNTQIKKNKRNETKKNNKIIISGHIVEKNNEGWKTVYVYGEAYDRGYAHGFLLHDDIKKAIRHFEFFLQETFHTTLAQFVDTTRTRIKPCLRDYPEIEQELKGICDGYNRKNEYKTKRPNLAFDTLLAWNSMMSLYDDFYKHKNMQPKMQAKTQDETAIKQRCAAFIATGEATKTGDIVMGHSTYSDFVTGCVSNIVLYVAPPPNQGFPFMMQTLPGFISSTTDWFVCSTGIVGCETTMSSVNYSPDFENNAPYFCRIRTAMQYAQTLDEYETIMTTKNAGDYACSWLFGDTNTGEIMILEIALTHTAAHRTKNGVYYGMNSAIDNVIRVKDTDENSFEDLRTSSGSRSQRLQYLLLDKYKGKIDISVGKKVLTDHYDSYLNKIEPGKRSICAHSVLSKEGIHPYYPHGAIDTKLVDSNLAKQMRFYARWGPPCGTAFHSKSFVRMHPEYKHFANVLEDFPVREWTHVQIK